MSTERSMVVGGIRVQVVRRPIKNLHLGVYPPDGRVRLAAPMTTSDDAVRLAVVGKLGWIGRQRRKFLAQPRQSKREMVSGESHFFLGRRYRLMVSEFEGGAASVVQKRQSRIELSVRVGAARARREAVLDAWYRDQLREVSEPLLERWQKRLGVRAAEWGIRRMKTKWGACNVAARRVWLNLELVKTPIECIEYIVVHELVHLLTRRHDERFFGLMDEFLPGWRARRRLLNSLPLPHVSWPS